MRISDWSSDVCSSDLVSVGAIGTFRQGDGYANNVAGVDARWQQGAHTATAQLLHSQSEYPVDIVDAYQDELGGDATPAGNAWRAEYAFGNRNWNFDAWHVRSEEHTSELQSLMRISYAVFCLKQK